MRDRAVTLARIRTILGHSKFGNSCQNVQLGPSRLNVTGPLHPAPTWPAASTERIQPSRRRGVLPGVLGTPHADIRDLRARRALARSSPTTSTRRTTSRRLI